MNIFMNEERKQMTEFFKALIQSEAWKDLERWTERERMASLKRMDDKSAAELSMEEVFEEKGFRKGLTRLVHYARQKAEGL